ncbi:MAG TPA: ATP-binding protein [Methanomassiliicoccales archaeon]|jgi:signal transduction histidine kinase/CheY-like chemotaxis protein
MIRVKVVILEDNESDFELTKRELRDQMYDFTVIWAHDKVGFQNALEQRPDILLLDYSLPGFDGISALRIARERYPIMPAIIVSGAIGEEVAIDTLKAGATDYVLKQHIGRLMPAIHRALQEADRLAECKRAEDDLIKSTQKFESLFSSSSEGICLNEMVFDDTGDPVDYRIIDVNPAYEKITGISRPNAVGRLASDIFGTKNLPFLKTFANVSESGRPDSFEIFDTKIGKHLRISTFSPGKGQFANLLQDITDRKNLEAQLKQRADDLASTNAELRQFAYVASHDLQEPLRMVSTYLGLLQRRYERDMADEAQEYIRFAIQGSVRMRELIKDLLEYSRLETKVRGFYEVDMNNVVTDVLTDLCPSIEMHRARIEVDRLPTIIADDVQMKQLLSNLVGNAIKFHGPRDPVVHISAVNDPSSWTISVKDNGIGINPAYMVKIFDVFQRLHTKEEYEGTGIGLAIAKKIVERHEGKIWVESVEGTGSTFFFTIPKRS